MPIKTKPDTISPKFSPEQIAAAVSDAPDATAPDTIDWSRAVVTDGGGVDATLHSLRRTRGPNKRPAKQQVAIRFSTEVLEYFRAHGPGWQTRMDEALKEFIKIHTSNK